MALHPDFPDSPFATIDPSVRWFPADKTLRESNPGRLIPPLVAQIRTKVTEFRESGYIGARPTSVSLLNWWFRQPHRLPQEDGTFSRFQYFFAQREALETIIYLCDVADVRDKFDLMRFDSSGRVSTGMFDEAWRRFVIKMATGSGKTKVLSMALTWSFFHKLYEPDSTLSRNFLVITPNIIVLDRLYRDFRGLRIFLHEPTVPENGFDGRNWKDDFRVTLHRQDEARVNAPFGNIFLTNIHRVYSSDVTSPSPGDDNTMAYFLGQRPTGTTMDSTLDLAMIVRDIDELMVLNDEAHHIHDSRLSWFQSIDDINNRLIQQGHSLALQLDVTATPRHNNGAIFVQTVSDYPLVEAISQNVVKHPILPDAPSRAQLSERQSAEYTERYADYIDLGVIEWRKAYAEHMKVGKKAILFVMADDTRNCDDLAVYLENRYPELKDAVLVIHTKNNGDISEAQTDKAKDELTRLREQAKNIDDADNRYKAIVSVLMLKEGWDVRNVTTIVGLRAYSTKSNILPEQTLGRGLRKMYPDGLQEYVSVVGTDAFMEFVESIQAEGVVIERAEMGNRSKVKTPLVIEVDHQNEEKDIASLDIEIPVLTPRIHRKYERLADLDIGAVQHEPVRYRQFSEADQRAVRFREITTGNITHTTMLDAMDVTDYRSVVGYFCQIIMKDLRLVSGYDILFGKIKAFVQGGLFGRAVVLDDPNTLRNLAEVPTSMTLIQTTKRAINSVTVQDVARAQIQGSMRVGETRPFVVRDQNHLIPKKSVFNRIVGDSRLELDFASFLERCPDVVSYARNYFAVHFKLDYVNADGDIANYYPDFFVKMIAGRIVVAETKGREDVDASLKVRRLRQWCEDVNLAQSDVIYDFVYVDQERFEQYELRSFGDLLKSFRDHKT